MENLLLAAVFVLVFSPDKVWPKNELEAGLLRV
jgi:hypothetical protein